MKKETIQTLSEHIGETHSEQAIYGYIRIINHYLNHVGEEAAKQAGYHDVLEYLGGLRERGMNPRTILTHLYPIKMYYQWLVDTGQRNDHPCRDLYLKYKINRAIPVETLYTKEELENILSTYRAKLPLVRNRDKIVLSLLVNQAVAVTEIIQLKTTDIDLAKGTINLIGFVRTKPRVLPLKGEQIMLLHDYITRTRPLLWKNNKKPREQDKDVLILSTRGRRMKPISMTGMFKAPMANGQKMTPQKIRQSVIANLLKSGQDLRIVQAFTGHIRVSSVEEYRQTGLEELKVLIQKLHPLQ